MNRRDLLRSITASSLLLAFSSGVDAPKTLENLSAAFHRAALHKVKLLVFVIPADDGDKYIRGQAFGEFLNFGPDEAVARLHGLELVAASMAEIRVLFPHQDGDDPAFVLVDPSAIPAVTKGIGVGPTALLHTPTRGEDPLVQARIDALAAQLMVHLPAVSDPARVASTLRADVLSRPISGSRWAQATGCGFRFEGEDTQLMARCGMGHVDPRSQRMLYFFDVL